MKRHRHKRTRWRLVARATRKPHQPAVKHGTADRAIIARRRVEYDVGALRYVREFRLHATKGFRSMREAA